MSASGAVEAPFLLEPWYRPAPWGGRRFVDDLGRVGVPAGPVGESWEVADLGDHPSRIVTGAHAGKTLREAFGAPYPLLVKVIDARDDLSVQLHPDAQAEVTGAAAAKEEAWVALADGGAVATFDGAVGDLPDDGRWLERMARTPLRAAPPDAAVPPTVVHVPPGTVHAILGGSLLVEVQNPSDVTWRLYDHGRVGLDGRPRALHLAEAAPLLRRGPSEPNALRDGGRVVAGRRFRLDLIPPGAGSQRGDDARVLIPLGRAEARGGSGVVTACRGRAIVLPPGVVEIDSDGWAVLASAPWRAARGA